MTTANVAPRQAQYFAALPASLARDTGGNSGCARRGKRLKFDGVLQRD